ncbi:MAG: MFS transporter [Clostridium sp.]|uniref:MFS transporter n=1 Tax=Clostridium sp. TaxID=1506 RepID=UPI003F3457FD
MSLGNSVFRNKELRNFCVYRLFFGIGYSIMIPIIPLYLKEMNVSTVMIGSIISLYGICETFTQLPFGVITDVIGDKLALKVALLVMCLVPIGYIFCTNGFMAGSLHVIQGGVLGMAAPATFSILARSVDKRKRGESTGFASAVFTIGGGIGAALAGFIISRFNNYRLVFFISFIIIFIAFLYFTINIKKVKRVRTVRKKDESVFHILEKIRCRGLRNKILLVSAVAFLGDYVYGCIIAIFHFYGRDVLGMDVGFTSFIISAYLIVFGMGAPVAGVICDKIGVKKHLGLSFFIMNTTLMGLIFIRNKALFTGVIIIYFLGATCLNAIFQSVLSEFGEEEDIKGFIFGFVGAVESIGYALGPFISAFVYEINKNLFFVSLLAVSMFVTILYLLTLEKRRR